MLVRIVIGLTYVAIAAGHGAVVIPPPRQAIDRSLAPWNGTVPLHHPNVESKTGWCPVPASGSKHCDVMHVAVFDTQFVTYTAFKGTCLSDLKFDVLIL